MKISELTQTTIQREALIPVALAGKNLYITLGQLLDIISKSVVFFDTIQSTPSGVYIVPGNENVSAQMVVYDKDSGRFYGAAVSTNESYGGIVENWTYYNEWKGMNDYMTSDNTVRTDCLFLSSEGSLYNMKGGKLVNAGITEAQISQLEHSTYKEFDSLADYEKWSQSDEYDPEQVCAIYEEE